MFPLQLGATHCVPLAKSWQLPEPSQKPLRPQVDCALPGHWLATAGELPAGTSEQVPTLPVSAHDWQVPLQSCVAADALRAEARGALAAERAAHAGRLLAASQRRGLTRVGWQAVRGRRGDGAADLAGRNAVTQDRRAGLGGCGAAVAGAIAGARVGLGRGPAGAGAGRALGVGRVEVAGAVAVAGAVGAAGRRRGRRAAGVQRGQRARSSRRRAWSRPATRTTCTCPGRRWRSRRPARRSRSRTRWPRRRRRRWP